MTNLNHDHNLPEKGELVKIQTLDLVGQVLDYKNSTTARVQVGNENYEVPLSDLEVLPKFAATEVIKGDVVVINDLEIIPFNQDQVRAKFDAIATEQRRKQAIRKKEPEMTKYRDVSSMLVYHADLHGYAPDVVFSQMRKVWDLAFRASDCDIFKLTTGIGKGHLFREFDNLLRVYKIPERIVIKPAERPFTVVNLYMLDNTNKS